MRSLALLFPLLLALDGQHAPGPQVFTFLSDVDDTDQPYGIYLPRPIDTSRKYPLVISLHGAWSNHRLNLRRVFGLGNRMGESDLEATRYFPRLPDIEFIVASPLARGTMGYQRVAERDVYAVLADVKRRFPIDPDRVYLTGLAMGGGGTLWLGLTRPDVWAAIAPVCPAPPAEATELAGNALNIPVKLFQGELDPLVKAEQTRAWHKRFLDAGVRAEYVEYPGVRHNSWDSAYKDAAIFRWFSQFKRERHPARVRFTTRDYEHASAYWLRIDGLTPGLAAAVDARIGEGNRIAITTSGLDGITLSLGEHPMIVPAKPVVISVDGRQLTARRAAGVISLKKDSGGWAMGAYEPAAGEKRAGAEGPIGAAITSRHIYVYGTADKPPPEEAQRRKDEATTAASWSSPRNPLQISFRVLADTEVKESDLQSSNLILFGARQTNQLIAKLLPEAPLALNPGAADYGLVYVAPAGGRYLVVSSGLPWWTRADQTRRLGPFAGAPFRALQTFGDFIVFKGGLDQPVVEGRFDRQWRLTAEQRTRLEATGAVQVRP